MLGRLHWIGILVAAGLPACGNSDPRHEGSLSEASRGDFSNAGDPPGCVDVDRDGHGTRCPLGPDCDDTDPGVTDECFQCATPQTGCPCDAEGTVTACGQRVAQLGDYVSCVSGERRCQGGEWGTCTLDETTLHRVRAGGVKTRAQYLSPCDDQCDPHCRGLDADPDPAPEGDAIYNEDGNISVIPEAGVGASEENLCADETAEALKTQLGLVLMMDSSGSMDLFTQEPVCTGGELPWYDCVFSDCCLEWSHYPTRWQTLEQPLKDFVLNPDLSGMAVGIEFFPEGASCSSSTYRTLDVGVIDVDAVGQRADLWYAIDEEPLGGTTPLLAALTGGIDAAQDWVDTPNSHGVPGYTDTGRPKKGVVILMTDGWPEGCHGAFETVDDQIQEQSDAFAAAQQAYAQLGIETFVIGMQGEAVDLSYLHTLASAGSGGTRPNAFIIDASDDSASQQVADALNTIREAVVSCEFQIPLPSQGVIDPAGTTLTIDSGGETREVTMVASVADCNPNGAYFDTVTNQVLLCPEACQLAKNDPGSKIDINYNCLGNCTSQTAEATPGPVDLFVMMDRSYSMHGSSWEAVRDAVSNFAHSADVAEVGLGIGYFPIADRCGRCHSCDYWLFDTCMGQAISTYPTCDLYEINPSFCDQVLSDNSIYWWGNPYTCTPSDYTSFTQSSSVPIAPLDAAQITQIDRSLYNTAPDGNTPTEPALRGALEYLSGHPRQAAVILASDGEPTECAAIEAVRDAAATGRASGVPTYVIGVGHEGNLNMVAQAGGGRDAILVAGGNAQEFISAMHEIRELVQSCTLEIPEPPVGQFNSEETQVYRLDASGRSTELTRVAASGDCGGSLSWYLTEPGASGEPPLIQLCPGACQFAQDSAGGRTEVLFSCVEGTGEGSVTYTYDNQAPEVACPDGFGPIWGDWSWSAETPGESQIFFDLATADDPDALTDWTPLTFTGPTSGALRGSTQDFRGNIACASQAGVCNPLLDRATETGGPAEWGAGIPLDVFVDQVLRDAGRRPGRYVAVRVRMEADDQGNLPVWENARFDASTDTPAKPELRITCEANQ